MSVFATAAEAALFLIQLSGAMPSKTIQATLREHKQEAKRWNRDCVVIRALENQEWTELRRWTV